VGGRGDHFLSCHCGRDEVRRRFYTLYSIGHWLADTRLKPISRTIGQGRVIDEFILSFTHDMEMPAMLPGVAPQSPLQTRRNRCREQEGVASALFIAAVVA
jgi:hypothetical protein